MHTSSVLSKIITYLGWLAILFFVAIYGVELLPHHEPPITVRWMRETFRQGDLIVLNFLISPLFNIPLIMYLSEGVHHMIQKRPGFSIVLANTVGRLSVIWMCMISVSTVNAQTPKNPVLVLPQEQRTQKFSLPKVGDQAQDFTLLDFKGRRFILSEQKSRKAVFLWFTNLCEGCQSKLPAVENLKTIFEKKGVDFVAVSQLGKDRKTVEDVIQSYKLTLRFLYDPDGKATERYSGSYVPGTCPLQNIYVIRKNGTITYASHFPGVEESELHELLGKVVERR